MIYQGAFAMSDFCSLRLKSLQQDVVVVVVFLNADPHS